MNKAHEEKLRAQLEKWGVDVDALSAKAETAKGDAKTQLEKRLAQLKELRAEAQQRLDEGKGPAMEDLKAGAEQAGESIKSAFKSALGRFK